jgi:hypothetical protein
VKRVRLSGPSIVGSSLGRRSSGSVRAFTVHPSECVIFVEISLILSS